jgi:hypothetical protein
MKNDIEYNENIQINNFCVSPNNNVTMNEQQITKHQQQNKTNTLMHANMEN